MVVQGRDLWSLVKGKPQVDPDLLAAAIQTEVQGGKLDFRTRLLIRDSAEALRDYWGGKRFQAWLDSAANHDAIEAIIREDLGASGFPSLTRRIVKATDPDDIRQFLRELSGHLHGPLTVYMGGSAPLILSGMLVRNTDDIDFVNEVPAEFRKRHALLNQLEQRYGLKLAHFQAHYLPKGWRERLHWLEPFGQLQIYLVDPYDIFLSKVFSAREKDRDDLRALAPQLDKATLVRRFQETTIEMRAAPGLREKAEQNWYILYGEPLPS